MDKSDIVSFLGRARLFGTLPIKELEGLAQTLPSKVLPADTTVFYRGDIANQVYLILSGLVAVETISTEGKTVSIASLEAGDVFGEMAVLDDGARSANIRTLQPTRLLFIAKARFKALLSEYPEFSDQIIRDLVRRLRESDHQIEAIMLLPLRRRLAVLLLDLFRLHGGQLSITQNDLADRLSATREKVNVNLQKLQDLGAVELGRGKIKLVDRDLLTRVR